jgi:Uma2 family endonuclease
MRFTIPQYRELGRTGLYEDVKTMLIDGELFVKPMPGPLHNFGLSATEEYLREAIAGQFCHIRNQQGFDIGTRNDPGPDLAVVPGSFRDYQGRTPREANLIVEIADSSVNTDTGTKAELYATAGVPDYWVLDVDGRQLHVFREPQPGGMYSSHRILTETEAVSPLAAPAATITVGQLLPLPPN